MASLLMQLQYILCSCFPLCAVTVFVVLHLEAFLDIPDLKNCSLKSLGSLCRFLDTYSQEYIMEEKDTGS